jgi:LacI family transcriptional regulator
VDDHAEAEHNPSWFSARPWNGVISRTTTPALVAACDKARLPLVDLNDGEPFAGISKIRPDNRAIGHMAAEDLCDRGYRYLYFCGYENRLWSRERRDGFSEALRLLGLDAGVHSLLWRKELAPSEHDLNVRHLAKWLAALPRPAGVMACHDGLGRQILEAAELIGAQVPEQLAVLGVNNDQVRCELSNPPLSSVATDSYRMGILAAQELERLMLTVPGAACDVRVEPLKIVTRRSTDGLMIPDRTISSALAIIREQACTGIKVQDVMRQVRISRGCMERGFKRYLLRSPQAEIRRVQIERIKQLLKETDHPLRVIADLTGFEHVEYLSVVFKRTTGESPGRFRYRAGEVKTMAIGGRSVAIAGAA